MGLFTVTVHYVPSKKVGQAVREEGWLFVLFCLLHAGLHWELPARREAPSPLRVTGAPWDSHFRLSGGAGRVTRKE